MNRKLKIATQLFFLFATLAIGTAYADGYWISPSGDAIRSGDGACVRSGAWSATPAVPGCDPIKRPTRIVLLPGSDGKVGAIVVKNLIGEHILDQAYEGLQSTPDSSLQRINETEASVKARYGDVLEARSPQPVTFVVRFETGSATKLTAESADVIHQLKEALANWPAPQLMVVGHTDKVGDDQSNDNLSLKRAQTVSQQLVTLGIPVERIETAGRGEREPLVPTEDGVANATNRRVEITLR
jgi:OOP family OmpA-OmpF porin